MYNIVIWVYKLWWLSLLLSCCSCVRTRYLCLQEHEALF